MKYKENNAIDKSSLIRQQLKYILTSIILITQFFRLIYWDEDTYLVQIVLNHTYSDSENYCLYINPLLSNIVQLLHKLWQYPDWFYILTLLFVTVAGFSVFRLIETRSNTVTKQAILSLIWFIVIQGYNIVHENYTVVTSLWMVTSMIFWYDSISKKDKQSKISSVLSIVYIVLAGLWRWQAAALGIPYFGILFIYKNIKNKDAKAWWKSSELRETVIAQLSIGIIFQSLIGYKFVIDNQSKYIDQTKYNEYRTDLVDYPIYSYDDKQTEFENIGISESYFDIISKYFYGLDTENLSTEKIHQVQEIASKQWDDIDIVDIVVNWQTIFIELWAIIVINISLIAWLNRNKSREVRILNTLQILGTFLIFIYFTLKGRFIQRVCMCILIQQLGQLLSMQIQNKTQRQAQSDIEKTRQYGRVVKTIAVISYAITFSLVAFSTNIIRFVPVQWVSFQNPFTVMQYDYKDSPERFTDDVYNGQTKLVWSQLAYSGNFHKYYASKGIIPLNLMRNNITTGNWIYGQNYYNEYLVENDWGNPVQTLLSSDNIYYVCYSQDVDLIKNYYKQQLGIDTEFSLVGQQAGINQYKIILLRR